MATKIISSAERIIFSGHAGTKEECETISLACEELAKSDKFRTVKYENGYAEFEKVGVARELKFAAMPYTVNFTFDSGVEKIAWSRDKNLIAGNYIYTSPGEIPSSKISSFGFCVILLSGYEIANVNIPTDVLGSGNVEKLTDTTYWIMTDGGMDIDITITTKQSTSKVSIDLTTLSGWSDVTDGSHTVSIKAKADGYQDSPASAGVTFTKQSQHTLTFEDLDGLTVNGSSVSSGYILQNGDVIKALKYGVSGDTPIDGSYVAHIDVSATPDTNITGSNGRYVVQNADIHIAGWLEEYPEGDTSEVTSQITYKA